MKFWQSFSKKAVLKQLFFVIALFAVLIPVAIWDSNTQVKVTFDSSFVKVRSDRYTMNVLYSDIADAKLEPLVEPGEKVLDAYDNDILRCGVWYNDTWGEYTVCADPDTSVCVVLYLVDGRTLVFSQKDDMTTTTLFNKLYTHLG